jgi:hypothetical protein
MAYKKSASARRRFFYERIIPGPHKTPIDGNRHNKLLVCVSLMQLAECCAHLDTKGFGRIE